MIRDEDLAKVYQHSMVPADGSHPEAETLAALAAGSLADVEKLPVLDHVMTCSSCREEFELLRAVSAAGREAAAVPRVPLRRWLPLAAALLLAVGALSWQFFGRSGENVVRGGAATVALVSPAADAAVGTTTTFLWHAVPGATGYRLEVVHLDGRVVVQQQTTDTAVTVGSTEPLLAGEYRWWVSVVTSAGERTSPTRALIVR